MDTSIAQNYLTVNARLNGFKTVTVTGEAEFKTFNHNNENGNTKPFFRVFGGFAVNDKGMLVTGFTRDEDNVGGAAISKDASTGNTATTVTVDSLLSRNGIDNVAFCKIDTESNEHAVLKGATKSLASGRIRELAIEGDLTASETVSQFKLLVGKYNYAMNLMHSPDTMEYWHLQTSPCATKCHKPHQAVIDVAGVDMLIDCLKKVGCQSVDMHFKHMGNAMNTPQR